MGLGTPTKTVDERLIEPAARAKPGSGKKVAPDSDNRLPFRHKETGRVVLFYPIDVREIVQSGAIELYQEVDEKAAAFLESLKPQEAA